MKQKRHAIGLRLAGVIGGYPTPAWLAVGSTASYASATGVRHQAAVLAADRRRDRVAHRGARTPGGPGPGPVRRSVRAGQQGGRRSESRRAASRRWLWGEASGVRTGRAGGSWTRRKSWTCQAATWCTATSTPATSTTRAVTAVIDIEELGSGTRAGRLPVTRGVRPKLRPGVNQGPPSGRGGGQARVRWRSAGAKRRSSSWGQASR